VIADALADFEGVLKFCATLILILVDQEVSMSPAPAVQERAFRDVFISHRHDDKRIDALRSKVRAAGFEPFRDLDFPELNDTRDVTRAKIEIIRQQLSRATCLIFAHSYASAQQEPEARLGVWMPWEVGFFDGAVSARIGVYLLDGPRGPVAPKDYFKGCEYLQLYEELTDETLGAFLRRNAVRERRIDNVAGAFVWLEHLAHESIANPTNVGVGITEWFADHAARFWRAQGNAMLADSYARLKVALDDARVNTIPRLRLRWYDELMRRAAAATVSADVAQSLPTIAPRAVPQAMTYAPRAAPADEAGLGAVDSTND
jgi:hypothetical protein